MNDDIFSTIKTKYTAFIIIYFSDSILSLYILPNINY